MILFIPAVFKGNPFSGDINLRVRAMCFRLALIQRQTLQIKLDITLADPKWETEAAGEPGSSCGSALNSFPPATN